VALGADDQEFTLGARQDGKVRRGRLRRGMARGRVPQLQAPCQWRRLTAPALHSPLPTHPNTRPPPQGKYKPLKLSCVHRAMLLTDLYQAMAAASAAARCSVALRILG
jgi:hypothetical protein